MAKTAEVRERERTVLEDSPRDWARLEAAKVRLLLRSRNLTEYEISRLLIWQISICFGQKLIRFGIQAIAVDTANLQRKR